MNHVERVRSGTLQYSVSRSTSESRYHQAAMINRKSRFMGDKKVALSQTATIDSDKDGPGIF